MEAGAIDEAGTAFERVIKRAAKKPFGYVGLGDVKLRSGAFVEAAELLERAVAIAPNYKVARYLLGMAYRGLGRREDAREQMTLGVRGKKAYLLDAWHARAGDFKVSASGVLERSNRLIEAGRADQAAVGLEKALQLRPDHVQLMKTLARAYHATGRYDGAVSLLQRALQLTDKHLDIYNNLGQCYLSMGRLNQALEATERAVELGPDMWKSHLNRGAVLGRLGRYEAAYDSLSAAVRLDPLYPDPYAGLGEVCVLLQRFEEAGQHFPTAIKRDPMFFGAHLGLCKT